MQMSQSFYNFLQAMLNQNQPVFNINQFEDTLNVKSIVSADQNQFKTIWYQLYELLNLTIDSQIIENPDFDTETQFGVEQQVKHYHMDLTYQVDPTTQHVTMLTNQTLLNQVHQLIQSHQITLTN